MGVDIRELLIRDLHFTDENLIKIVLECAEVKAYPRGKTLVDAGDPNTFICFLINGLFGGYTHDGEIDRCECFVFRAGDTLIDSFPPDATSRITIKAIEDSVILRIPVSKIPEIRAFPEGEKLRDQQETWFRSFHTQIQHTIAWNDAENRLSQFAATFPELIGRVPDQELASILGISERTLFRARKKLREKN